MNKKNKILVGCLSLLLALSVGYALFSDTITINGTATAKGSFDITATCEPGISSKLGTVESLSLAAEGGYENDTCSVDDDTVSFSTNFLYPEAIRYFTVKFTNDGSIDAIYDKKNKTDTEEFCIADNMNGENKECKTQSNANASISKGDYAANLAYTTIAIEDSNGNILSEEEAMKFYDVETGNITLKPGYSMYTYYMLWFSHIKQTELYEGNEFFAEYSVTVNHPYKQVTQ